MGHKKKKKKKQKRVAAAAAAEYEEESQKRRNNLNRDNNNNNSRHQDILDALWKAIEPEKHHVMLQQHSSPKHQKEVVSPLSLSFPNKKIKRLRLEANFYPKFENEDTTTNNIREQMKERIAAGCGFLEVSLKHSGSLILWSGGQRFYSKNATDNVYTATGEILLRQHFVRAWWDNNNGDTDNNNNNNDFSNETRYHECSQFISQHRLTLAFEVVTNVLGDHGDHPNRNYVILTAISHRPPSQHFYSTAELVEFAQRYRLPHNDVWMFTSVERANDLFHLYDTKRETGLATDIVKGLSAIANSMVVSLCPHAIFQGEILEGFVVRYVPLSKKENKSSLRMGELALRSQDLLRQVPPQRPDCFELVKNTGGREVPSILSTNISSLFQHSQELAGSGGESSFEKALFRILEEADGPRRAIQRFSAAAKSADIPSLTASLIQSDDFETRQIARCIHLLSALHKKVNYNLVLETNNTGSCDRWLCIIHVIHDSTFQKYRDWMDPSDMSLFRGFVVELQRGNIEEDTGSPNNTDNSFSSEMQQSLERSSNDVLMLKMKLLPYIARTFGCRNGLGNLKHEGVGGFVKYTNNLLSKWGISEAGQQKWKPFFREWAHYAQKRLNVQLPGERDLPQLNASSYLVHLERFQRKFSEDKARLDANDNLIVEATQDSKNTGLLVFFPGITGCGKSTLLGSELIQGLRDKLSNDHRKVSLRMGDATKGRFWSTVRKERAKDPRCIYIADKNVPGWTSWGVVADVCASTSALGVPIIPDALALKTTRIRGMRKPGGDLLSDSPHFYPFSLTYLAVCIQRVLDRPPQSHPGGLDSSTRRAAFVVIKFYALYRGISDLVSSMRDKFESRGAQLTWSPIKVPFLKENAQALPQDLVDVLTEALQVQFYYDLTKVDLQFAEEHHAEDLHKRIQKCIHRHKGVLDGMSYDLMKCRATLKSQILERVSELGSREISLEDPTFKNEVVGKEKFVRLACVQVPVSDLHELLLRVFREKKAKALAKLVLREKSAYDVLIGTRCTDKRLVTSTHVTLAHCKSCSQEEIYSHYGEMEGHQVSVRPVALIWSDRVAAFEVILYDNGTLEPMNEFVHITVWVQEGANAVEANSLPQLVQQGLAEFIDIPDAEPLSGKVKLWKS